MRADTLDLLKTAHGRYALGAFNVCNLEQVHGLFQGASRAHAPVLAQFTRAIRQYAHPAMLEGLLRAAEFIYPEVCFGVHLDHGDEASCADAISSGGYSSVMIDGSHLPFEENVALTRRVVEQAHGKGIAVEAELGVLGGREDDLEEGAVRLTDPRRVVEFVERTGCDFLAVAVGTSHGAYKFRGPQRIHFERLEEISRHVPSVPLVLHGGSGVPLPEVKRINAAGGALEPFASGVSDEELSRAVQLGIAKVNIGTDGRLVWTRVHREFFRQQPAEFDFMAPGAAYVEAYAGLVAGKCRLLGATGQTDSTTRSSESKG